jgi:hypothetical protein
MPVVGGVFVPDRLMPSAGAQAKALPSFGDIVAASTRGTWDTVKAALPLQFETLTRDKVDLGYQAQQEAQLRHASEEFDKAPPASVADLTGGRVGLRKFITDNIAASLPQMAATLAGSAAGAVVGGPGGAIAGGMALDAPIFSATNVARAVQENKHLDVGGAERSLAWAPAQAASDVLEERFLPGAGKLLGKFAATQSGGFLARTAKAMLKAGGTEAVTEAAQQLAERSSAGLPTSDTDAAKEYVNAAVTAFAMGGALGAGGGFRRTPAIAKAPEAVTVQDMGAHVDAIISGAARRGPEQQLGLPLAGGQSNSEQQLGLPLAQEPAAPPELPASQLPQIPGLAPTLSSVPPETQLTLPAAGIGGVYHTDNLTPETLPENAAVPPQAEAAIAAAMPTPQVPLSASTTLSRGLDGAGAGVAQLNVPDDSFRPFKADNVDDIHAAITDKKSAPTLVEAARQELVHRQQEAVGLKPLTTDNYQDRVDELKKGIRGSWVQKLVATDPHDLLGKVYNRVFVDQDTAASVTKFAQRVGILDDKLEPGPMAKELEARKAADEATRGAGGTASELGDTGGVVAESNPAPPVDQSITLGDGSQKIDPDFKKSWDATLKAAGIQRLSSGKELGTPPNLQAARAQVFRLLANDSRSGDGGVTQIEKVARKLGLVTDDDAMDVTPLGRQTFLTTPEGLEETVAAAQRQGFTGAAASVFERGARSHIAGEAQTTFADFGDMAAHEAGKVWAKNFTESGAFDHDSAAAPATAVQTEKAMTRLAKRQTVNPRPGEGPKLAPQQIEQASLNRLIDGANLRAVKDTDVIALRKMVREGATAVEVGKAIQNAQAGRSLFEDGPTQPYQATPAQPLRHAQPMFKEMNTQTETGKATMRAETEGAARAYGLRQLVRFALAEKGITPKRAEKLNALLDEGKVDQVSHLMKDFEPDRVAKPRKGQSKAAADLDRLLGENDTQLEQALTGKTFEQALDHVVETAPSPYYKAIITAVRALQKKVAAAGVDFHIAVVNVGDTAPARLNKSGLRGLTVMHRDPNTVTVYLKGATVGRDAGVNHQIVAHEMIHAVTMGLVQSGLKVANDTPLGRAVKDLNDLRNAVVDHFNARARSGDLTAFERAYFHRETNALADPDEILAWGLTNPEMQRYLASIEYTPKQSVFGRLVNLVRDMLGLDVKYNSALTELMRVSEAVMGADARDIQSSFPRNDLGLEQQPLVAAATEDAASAQNRTVGASTEALKNISAMTDKVVDQINPQQLRTKARQTVLGWQSSNQIERQFGHLMPALAQRNDAHRERTAVRSRIEQMGTAALQNFEKLERDNPRAARWVNDLMALTTKAQVDPDQTWEQHTHLQDKVGAKEQYTAIQKLKNDLKRGDRAGWKMFSEFRALNESQNYARMAANLHGMVAMDPELSLGVSDAESNPTDQFMHADGLVTAEQARDWWSNKLHQQVAQSVSFINEKKGQTAATGSDADIQGLQQHLSPIELQISAIHEALGAMQKAPYFHLGRFGDYFGSASVAKLEDGTADPKALERLSEELHSVGLDRFDLHGDDTKAHFMMRFETADEMNAFKQIALKLEKEGVLTPDKTKAGPRNKATNYGVQDGLPQFVQAYIQNIEASPMYTPTDDMEPEVAAALIRKRDEAVKLAVDTWLQQQPDSSITKVLTKRYTVLGNEKDMVRSFAHRWRVGAISLANVAAAPKFNRAFVNMRAQVNAAVEVKDGDKADPVLLNDLMREMRRRDAMAPLNEGADAFDKLRAIGHAYFLGLSPAYAIVNMTQLGVTALPEIAKKVGYRGAFAAMRRATPIASRIMAAVAHEATQLGWEHRADVAITDAVLKRAGLSESQANFIQHMLATGTIDIGSAGRALGQIATNRTGSKLDVALKYASAVGLYSETYSRLITALAAADAHGDVEGKEAYAAKTVSESMFDYQSWNTARQLGKQGFAGRITPMFTQFMSYSVQVTEKLYSEIMSAVGKARIGETPEQTAKRASEARTFLVGHLTAVTALAGTLGLPLASVFAAVIERLVGSSDEPYDATAAWRNFLAHVFGQDTAEVISRGLPRALGFDISARVGEQDLLPFSRLISDKRSWRESVEGYFGRAIGASPSMLLNVAEGGEMLAQGDIVGGAKAMLPVALKGPVEAYRMTTDGYVDTKGNKLPMSPGAAAILWQLVGFSPAEKAEYSEARGDQMARRGQVTRRAGQLRNAILDAAMSGNGDAAAEAVRKAQEFDADNPAFAVIPSLSGAMAQRMQRRAQAQAMSAPLGVSMKDIAGRNLTKYANVQYAQ